MNEQSPYVGRMIRQPEKRRWIIAAEPHVMRKLKRWFEGIPKDTPGDHAALQDSPVNCKDLLWFMGNMPLQVSAEDERYLRERADVERERERAVVRVLTGAYAPTEFKVGITPWPFQFLPAELCLAAGGVLCADEIGLGKTLEGALLISDPRARPALVVCPKQIVKQWVDRLGEYIPGIRTHVLRTCTPYPLTRGTRGKTEPLPDVVISTYAKLAGWVGALSSYVRSVTYDEVHNLCHEWKDSRREERIKKYEAALYIRDRVPYRIGLSGTPIKGYGGQIRTVMGVLLPDSLGTLEEFAHAQCNGDKGVKAKVVDPRALGAEMIRRGVMVSRSREDVGRYLPPVTVHVHPIECDMKRLHKVKLDTIEFAKTLLRHGGSPEAKRHAAAQIDWKLRLATGLAKAPAVMELVKIVAARTPVLVLAWHHEVYAEYAKGLVDFEPLFFHGKMSDKQKADALKAFISGKTNILIMSHGAAEGIDGIQAVCSTIIMGELDWTYARMMKQNVGRLQREGQKHNVFVHVPVGDAGADPVIAEALGIKREQLEGIIRPDTPLVEEVQTNPAHIRQLAQDWLAAQDPKALAAIQKEIREAEAVKQADKEERRARPKGRRRAAPEPASAVQVSPAPQELEQAAEDRREIEGDGGVQIPGPAPRLEQEPPAPPIATSSPTTSSTATSSRRTRRRARSWRQSPGAS